MSENNTAIIQGDSFFSINPNAEHVIVGAMYTGFALLIMPLYIVIVWVGDYALFFIFLPLFVASLLSIMKCLTLAT